MAEETEKNNGAAAAAFLAAGIGALALGIATTVGEANPVIGNALNVYKPVGALSGEAGIELVVWIVAWLGLGQAWKDKRVDIDAVIAATLLLIALGFLGTFPVFFGIFTSG